MTHSSGAHEQPAASAGLLRLVLLALALSVAACWLPAIVAVCWWWVTH